MNVYAFEWNDCVYESGYEVESLHATREGADAAMEKASKKKIRGDKKWAKSVGIPDPTGNPMWATRVREIEVLP